MSYNTVHTRAKVGHTGKYLIVCCRSELIDKYFSDDQLLFKTNGRVRYTHLDPGDKEQSMHGNKRV